MLFDEFAWREENPGMEFPRHMGDYYRAATALPTWQACFDELNAVPDQEKNPEGKSIYARIRDADKIIEGMRESTTQRMRQWMSGGRTDDSLLEIPEEVLRDEKIAHEMLNNGLVDAANVMGKHGIDWKMFWDTPRKESLRK